MAAVPPPPSSSMPFYCNNCLVEVKVPSAPRIPNRFYTNCQHVLCENCKILYNDQCAACTKTFHSIEITNQVYPYRNHLESTNYRSPSPMVPSAQIGNYATIAADVTVGANAYVGGYSTVYAGSRIGHNSRIGNYATIASYVTINENSSVGSYSTIGDSSQIGHNSRIGNYATIASYVTINENSSIGSYSTIGAGSRIGWNSQIENYATLGQEVSIGNRVKVNPYASCGSNVEIQDDSIQDRYATVQKDANVSSKVYIGQYASIGQGSIISESAIIEKYTSIPGGTIIEPYTVAVRSPSTQELYQNYAHTFTNDKLVKLADSTGLGKKISREFNAMLSEMIDSGIQEIMTNCVQTNQPTKTNKLSEVISLYLIHFHGLERYQQHRTFGHGSFNQFLQQGSLWSLQFLNERHFSGSKDGVKALLDPETTKKLITLMALDQDADRTERVTNETFCQVAQEIKNGKRNVECF